MIGFVYADDTAIGEDGAIVQMDASLVNQSVNCTLLADGHVYPAFYGTLHKTLREHLALIARNARTGLQGLWPRATADPNGAANVVSSNSLKNLVIWPKLFRRLVSYFADTGRSDLQDFQAWLLDDAVNRDDQLQFLKDADGEWREGRLHDVVNASGTALRLSVWPEDIVIKPDPAVC